MSIRRIGGFNPFVQTPGLIQGQRRVEAVEKHIGAEDAELKSEEDILNAINAQHQAELEELEAERAAKERETAELRARLLNVDGFERTQRELVDLKGGTEAAQEGVAGAEAGADKPGVTLAHLFRASAYAAAARAERVAAEQAAVAQAAVEQAAASLQGEAEVAPGVDENWMEAELSALQAELDEVDEAEEAYSDPGAESFFASLEDIENLEEGGADFGDSGANAFVASLDDIALLVPELAAEPSVVVSEEVPAPAPEVVDSFEAAPVHTAAPAEPGAPAPVAELAPAQVQGEPSPVAASEPEARPVGLPFDEDGDPSS